mmetsp:Transcript_14532/g.27413  ORF Transcript_14532/g.27413 Transcript_14532/m.27413 type:complete len:224 (-) Transcript_14532:235-906(-)
MSLLTPAPLIARSSDGSLIGVHQPGGVGSGSGSAGLIRCYDGSVSNGSLKFTLRVPSRNHNHNHNHDFLTCSSSTIDTTNVPFAIPSHLHVHANPSKTPFSWSSDSLLLHRSPDDIPTALSVEPETPVPRRDRILHPLPFGIILAALVATTSRTANGGDVRLVVVLLVSTELLRTVHVVVGMGRGAGAMFLLHSLRRRERDGWGLDDVVSSGLSLLRRHRLSE